MIEPQVPQPNLRSALANDGFVLIPNALSAEELSSLRRACAQTAALARNGNWPHVRTLPKQFPPWNTDISHGIWGVQHLLHPDLPAHETFAASYFAPHIILAVKEILDCESKDLVMELYNLLIRPDEDFALRWHRDDVSPDVVGRDEEEVLRRPIMHAQWNLALYDDQSLVVVPGSHARARTEAEIKADPFEAHVPGQLVVKMRAGDVVFYDNNILHRGVYGCGTERMTLHGSMGVLGADLARARNVLQHGIGEWVGRCEFEHLQGTLGEKGLSVLAGEMRDRAITMGSGENVGYSQRDV